MWHLWYLVDESIALAFYDENVPLETKVELLKAIQLDEANEIRTVGRTLLIVQNVL